ncbi:UNVERIFIED_CONTAM: hypothetical protein RMT77_014696 [Armadillidium vulgare]
MLNFTYYRVFTKFCIVILFLNVSVETQITKIPINNCKCGMQTFAGGRIYGGVMAKDSEFPWQAGLVFNGRIVCGGSIINEKYILTAAHCFQHYDFENKKIKIIPVSKVKIFVGSYKLGITIRVGKKFNPDLRIPKLVIIHPRYDPIRASSDISIVKIDPPFKEYSKYVLPICLPIYGYSYENSLSIVTGWGKLKGDSVQPRTHLRKAEIMVRDYKICENKLEDIFMKEIMLCGFYPGRDTCQGDSGGPMITKINRFQYIQIGITSFGKGCKDSAELGVYTKVDHFVPWIKKTTRDATYCRL